MVYVCNYLDEAIGCDYRQEVKASMDQVIDKCGNGNPGKTPSPALFIP